MIDADDVSNAEKYLELMERMVVSAVKESEWFWRNGNTNQKTQEYVKKQFGVKE